MRHPADKEMSFLETVAAVVPVLGLVLAFLAFRRGNPAIGAGILLASIGFAGVVAIEGNRRPIAGFVAFGFLALAIVAGEKKKSDALPLACFSAAFVTLIITAMYT
jgi:hypothetical protein